MPYLLARTVLVWHPPKTGGTWLVKACRAAGIELTELGQAHDNPKQQPVLAKTWKNAVLHREPWPWYWSSYWYLRQRIKFRRSDVFWRMWPGLEPHELETWEAFMYAHAGNWSLLKAEYWPGPGTAILNQRSLRADLVGLLREMVEPAQLAQLWEHPAENVTGQGPAPEGPAELRRRIETE